jgi:hypothetical protein
VAGLVLIRWGVGLPGLLAIGLLITVTLISLPAWVFAAGALGVVLGIGPLTSSGILPGLLDFADFGLVFAGLAAVSIRHGSGWTRDARHLGTALLFLFGAIWIAWLINPSELLRPVFSFALWAEPFVLVLTLLIEPPTPNEQRMLLKWFAFLVALQIPFVLYQWKTFGPSDPIVGALLGSGVGAHLVSGVCVLAGLALITWGFSGTFSRGVATTVLAAPLIVGIPLLADAKQVVFALPVAAIVLILTIPGGVKKIWMLALPAVALVVLVTLLPLGKAAVTFLEDAGEGRSGKIVALETLTEELGTSLTGWAFGLGPANGLSRAAFLTDPGYYIQPSAARAALTLGLEPASLPPILAAEAVRVSGPTSFNSPLSSAFGVLSDTGIVGLVAFGAVIASVVLPLWRRRRSWLSQTALAGWAMSVPLAATFDWWEQPPFTITLALLTALALVWVPAQAASGGGRERTVAFDRPAARHG